MSTGPHPTHADIAIEEFQRSFISLQFFSRNDDFLDFVAAVGVHLVTNVTFDTVSSNDDVSLYPFTRLYLDTGLEFGICSDNFVIELHVYLLCVNTFE